MISKKKKFFSKRHLSRVAQGIGEWTLIIFAGSTNWSGSLQIEFASISSKLKVHQSFESSPEIPDALIYLYTDNSYSVSVIMKYWEQLKS